jgi:hypothetical protein
LSWNRLERLGTFPVSRSPGEHEAYDFEGISGIDGSVGTRIRNQPKMHVSEHNNNLLENVGCEEEGKNDLLPLNGGII